MSNRIRGRSDRARVVLCAVVLAAAGAATAANASQMSAYAQAGERIAQALNDRDAADLNAMIDVETMISRIMEGLPEMRSREDLRAGLREGAARFGENLTSAFDDQMWATFIRGRELDGERRALIRLDLGDQGINYYDFVLGEDKFAQIRIMDWHDFARGQAATQSVRQALSLAMPASESMVARLLGVARIDSAVVRDYQALVELAKAHDFIGWLKRYDQAEERVRNSRPLLLERVMVASATQDEALYRQALSDVARHLGEDPRLALVLVDHYIYEENYPAAHRAIERAREYTGGDAALDSIDANVYYMQENWPEAARLARSAIAQDPDYVTSYWTLLDACVFSGNFDEAVSLLQRLEEFGYEFDAETLAQSDGYARFAGSTQFAQWRGEASR